MDTKSNGLYGWIEIGTSKYKLKLIAFISWLGIKFTNKEEYFVALGVIDIVYLFCVFGYMIINP